MIFFICSSTLAYAQSSTPPAPLSLSEALQRAQLRSPQLRAGDLGIAAANAAAQEQERTRYPGIHYRAGILYAPSFGSFGYDEAATNDGQVNAQLAAEQDLYNGGQNGMHRQQATLDLHHAQLTRDLTRANLEFDVTQSFLEALRARQNVVLERQSVQELQEYRDFVRRQFAGGNSNGSDVLKTEVQLQQEQLNLQKAVSDEVIARYSLASVLGTPQDTSFQVQGSYDSIFTESAYNVRAYDSLLNLNLSLAQNELERAKIDVDLSEAAKKPVVHAIADAGILSTLQNFTLPSEERQHFFGASIGISVDGLLYDWGLNDAQTEQKRIQVETLQYQLDQQKRELQSQLKQLSLLVSQSRKRLTTLRELLQIAQESYDLARSRYAVGNALAQEVLDAHKQVTDTKLLELQILSDIEGYRTTIIHLLAQPAGSAPSK